MSIGTTQWWVKKLGLLSFFLKLQVAYLCRVATVAGGRRPYSFDNATELRISHHFSDQRLHTGRDTLLFVCGVKWVVDYVFYGFRLLQRAISATTSYFCHSIFFFLYFRTERKKKTREKKKKRREPYPHMPETNGTNFRSPPLSTKSCLLQKKSYVFPLSTCVMSPLALTAPPAAAACCLPFAAAAAGCAAGIAALRFF